MKSFTYIATSFISGFTMKRAQIRNRFLATNLVGLDWNNPILVKSSGPIDRNGCSLFTITNANTSKPTFRGDGRHGVVYRGGS